MTSFRRTGLAIVLLCCAVVLGAPPAFAATTQHRANAAWTVTDGCVETRISVSTSTDEAGAPQNFVFVEQSQTCDDPNVAVPIRTLEGTVSGGQFSVNRSLTSGRLVFTAPVTCSAYTTGACDVAPYDSGTISVDLTFASTGRVVRVTDTGLSCLYRYGQATGSIVIGDLDLLATDGGSVPSDSSETNLVRCTPTA